ncbi:MAG: trypsin-like peptidase domain-containing protein [bacterium]|nr:trypsin-like peptidase domain-containing protein [bacterium]
MSAYRIIIVSVLSCLAGILATFGVSGVVQRQANASFDSPGSASPALAAIVPSSGGVGPGGNFVTEVYKAVSPAVVHITNHTETVIGYDFFRGPVKGLGEAVGSGVIIDPSGYILTNSHVVQNPTQLTVVLSDQSSYPAKLVGNDTSTDLALLKIESPKPLPTAQFGDSNAVEIGEWVVAIGNPRGYDWTVTAGVVSAKNRAQPSWEQRDGRGQVVASGATIAGLIQTDAAINAGNSGGPLLNARGEIIGINERIAVTQSSDGSIGIGLAIPSNTAKSIFTELKQYGRVQRSWLGVTVIHEITKESAKRYNFPVSYGLVVESVLPSGPAERGGIIPGTTDGQRYQFDIIASADGQSIRSRQDMIDIVRNSKPGQAMKLHLFKIRNGKSSEADVTVTLSAVPTSGEMQGYI